MEAITGTITVPASSAVLVYSIPIKQLHNIAFKAGGTLFIGGDDVTSSAGFSMSAGDVSGWNWRDFRDDEAGKLTVYATAAVATTITYLCWRR